MPGSSCSKTPRLASLEKKERPMSPLNFDLQPASTANWSKNLYVRLIGFGLVYFLAVIFGVMLVTQPEGISVIWPAVGVALAALLLIPQRDWLAFLAVMFAINLFSNLISDVSLPASIGFALANTLEPALGGWLMRRWLNKRITFARLRDVLSLVAVVVLVDGFTALLWALIPTLAFGAPYIVTWLSWWILDGLSMLIITPFIITWVIGGTVFSRDFLERKFEILIWLIILIGSTWLMFGAKRLNIYVEQNPYMLFPILIWVAFRFSPRASASALVLTSVIALYGATLTTGFFPMGGTSPREKLISIQAFLCVASVTTMVLSTTFTERKQAEIEREKLINELSAKNAELERFTYTVSHDLKSPIVTIRGFLGYLIEDARSGNMARMENDIQRITNATNKMQDLLHDLLELSRIGRIMNAPQTIQFDDLLHDALDIVHGQLEAHHVTVLTQPNLPAVHVDRQRLTEVLQNLLDNAVKYMGDQSDPHIEIGQSGEEDGKPIFFVKDNGIGIAPEYRERIFGLFNKLDAKSDGTGIGLALVKRIIEVHGGRIWVESEIGKGSTFYFSLQPN